jgi:putative endonuclease
MRWVTVKLTRKIFDHKEKTIPGFTQKYKVNKLVYVEKFSNVEDAINREKHLKTWNRKWKIELIQKHNPQWQDLFV